MNIIEIMERFPIQESCVEFLESIRFKNGAYCPLCGSTHVAKRNDSHNHIGRWNCHDCKSTFKAVQNTVFHGTKIPLQKWFLAITIMSNAKKSLSSCQLARDIKVTQQSSWYMMQRIRAEMASKNDILLQGVIEADETYIGGKPRKPNKRDDDDKPENQNPRGRGTKKSAVIGAVERGGNVVAKSQDDLTGKGILNFIMNSIKPDESVLITDEYRAYNATNNFVKREVIKHQNQYVDGHVHTNSPSKASGDCSNEHGTVSTTTTKNNFCHSTSPKHVTSTITVRQRTYLTTLYADVLPKPFQWAR